MRDASRRVSVDYLEAVNHAARNIRAVARRQKPPQWTIEVEPGVRVSQRVQPIETVGCYIPGGRFSLVSTLLMTAIPAQQAGVGKIVIASPQPSDELLAAATTLGLWHIARVGGAQAIAALAYGTETIPHVDKIVGPGNRYVTAAKRLVSGDCAIDLLAGPTEAIVFAERGNPRFIAADLLAQSEHDPDAIALFVTTSSSFGRIVAAEIERQMSEVPKANPAWQSLAKNGVVLIARGLSGAVRFINRFAPEHLSLSGAAAEHANRFDSAGSIFCGDRSAQSFGDYASGTNHVLPTGGVARARGGLSTADFVKCVSVQRISRAGCARLTPVVIEFAKAEGLLAHGRSVEVRR
jgi:histidinol dehydrogenase